MRVACACLLVCLLFVSSFAQAETPGFMSIYLDADATIWDGEVPAPGLVTLYVCLTESAFGEIQGYEFGYTFTGNAMVSATTFLGAGAVDAGEAGAHQVTLESPLGVAPVTVLTQLSLFILDANPIEFTLRGLDSGIPDAQDLPAVTLPGGALQPVCPAAWDENGPTVCLTINEVHVVLPRTKSYECYGILPVEQQSWDAIKSMYR